MRDGLTDGKAIGRPRASADCFGEDAFSTKFKADKRDSRRTLGTLAGPPSKPLVGILGDVEGRIVPVAPPPVSN
jgi:hypothetical protein